VVEDPYPQPLEHAGWSSDLRSFREAPASLIRGSLQAFVRDATLEQLQAWDESIPRLQAEATELARRVVEGDDFSAILEYRLPMEYRRPDVILLASGPVVVLELKGKRVAARVDVDQASAYARDLRGYHRECSDREVVPALVLMHASGARTADGGVAVLGPDQVDELVAEVSLRFPGERVSLERFLDPGAYRPLPSLVEAARELLQSGEVRRIGVVDEKTRPTLDLISNIAREAARTRTRRLVLLTGLPGTGKTLVGLQLAHARFLDDLAIRRGSEKPAAPAVYLSGNGPLVEVLQYELRGAGGGGKAFVRDVKAYVATYSKKPTLVPPEHVLIFDEAQRAFDAKQVARKHNGGGDGRSEPEHFIEFAERVPEWCVVVGLIGSGQEIHIGEEGGLTQWRTAIERSSHVTDWVIHAPPHVAGTFNGLPRIDLDDRLHLTAELRFHLATDVHAFVDRLLRDGPDLPPHLGAHLNTQGYHYRVTRDLAAAKEYLRARYAEDPDARFGMVASSKDRDLERFGIPNGYFATGRVQKGPWFAEGEENARSCRHLDSCVTEFGCQGLELDAVLLAWGTDLVRDRGRWSNARARGYRYAHDVRDPMQLRVNSYRVLLTRGRDATVVYVPPLPELDETFKYLVGSGFLDLGGTEELD
jgi:hypothetical protein